jgi:hypothetical protein
LHFPGLRVGMAEELHKGRANLTIFDTKFLPGRSPRHDAPVQVASISEHKCIMKRFAAASKLEFALGAKS